MNDDIMEKVIIYINSVNGVFTNNNFDFYFDLTEPIRNAEFIKIMKSEIILNPKNKINNLDIEDTDPVYVVLKKYHRVCSSILKLNAKGDDYETYQVKCFEIIPLNIGHNPSNEYIAYKTEYSSMSCGINDANTYVINPLEHNLRRFDVQLYDKNFNIIRKSEIKSFAMTLCIYSSRRKITMV